MDIDDAVLDGSTARTAFYTVMGEDDEQQFGAPAADADIAAIEQRIGGPLPATYARFLRRFNGWKMFDAATDLLSARAVIDAFDDPKLATWRKTARDVEGVDTASWMLIGRSKIAAQKYFLDTATRDDGGEMLVIDHEKTVQETYPTFLAFLIESTRQYRELTSDIEGGGDLADD